MNITKMEEFMRENDLMIIERCIENKNEKLDVKEEPFEKLMFFYKSALKQLELQMNIIKDEFKLIYNYDLIDHIDTRIKEPKSIVKKMEKKKYDKTYLNLIEKINDIAGIRIVCTLKDDIFFIRDLVKQIPDIHILKEKDYVTNPKESGYKSYHMLVSVPIFLSDSVVDTKVEIQIRTIAMDFWASLEHDIHYKADRAKLPAGIDEEMFACAEKIAEIDRQMQDMYRRIADAEANGDAVKK